MFRILLLLIIALFCIQYSHSQVIPQRGNLYNYTNEIPDYIFIQDDNIPLYNEKGIIELHQDQRLAFLIEQYNEDRIYIGYRIQIFSGKERGAAQEKREEFLKIYPNITAHLIYQQPNFKLRIGDFTTRLEALHFFENIKSEFPSAFVIKDEISIKLQDEKNSLIQNETPRNK